MEDLTLREKIAYEFSRHKCPVFGDVNEKHPPCNKEPDGRFNSETCICGHSADKVLSWIQKETHIETDPEKIRYGAKLEELEALWHRMVTFAVPSKLSTKDAVINLMLDEIDPKDPERVTQIVNRIKYYIATKAS